MLASVVMSLLVALAQAPPTSLGQPAAAALTGGTFDHRVLPGETLSSIGARYGVEWPVLVVANSLENPDLLTPGQVIQVDNRHIVPPAPFATGIVINIPQRMLFYFVDGSLAGAWPVALGRPDWPTPTGRFAILTREEDPTWDVPVSIQEEMRREGRPVITRIPPGPDNPLGAFWLGLNIPGFGIHGTIVPSSIYGFRTHGCIRLHPNDIPILFRQASEGTPVQIIYEPVLIASSADGTVFLEVHRDIYGRAGNPEETIEQRIEALDLEAIDREAIHREAIGRILEEAAGVARPIA